MLIALCMLTLTKDALIYTSHTAATLILEYAIYYNYKNNNIGKVCRTAPETQGDAGPMLGYCGEVS